MAGGKDKNVYDASDSSDKGINLSHEHPLPHYGTYDPRAYYSFPPQHHAFRPYQTSYPRGQGSYPPASYPLPGFEFRSYSDSITTAGDHVRGVDSISTQRTDGNDFDNEGEANMKSEDRKSQLRWNATMDNILLDVLGQAAREGKRNGKKWDTAVWNDLIATLSEKSLETVRSAHIENRLRQMRTEYLNFLALKSKSGVSYDRSKQTIVAPQGFWEDILSNPKNQKKYKAFRERGVKWDFEKLATVIGDSHATGFYALGGLDRMDKTNTDEGKSNIPGQDESIDLDDEIVSSSSTKAHPKRQHGKKARVVDEVKEMLQGVNDHLEKLRETVDPLTFGRTLREAVMGLEGYSSKNKSMAFKLLMKNRPDAEFFVLTDEEGRKDMFNDMGIEVGDP